MSIPCFKSHFHALFFFSFILVQGLPLQCSEMIAWLIAPDFRPVYLFENEFMKFRCIWITYSSFLLLGLPVGLANNIYFIPSSEIQCISKADKSNIVYSEKIS